MRGHAKSKDIGVSSVSSPNVSSVIAESLETTQQRIEASTDTRRARPERLCDWTVEDVVSWSLTTTMAPQAAAWIRNNEISGIVLQSLTEADLLAMGMEPFGRRRQLLLCRQDLLDEAVTEPKARSPNRRSQCSITSSTFDRSCTSSRTASPKGKLTPTVTSNTLPSATLGDDLCLHASKQQASVAVRESNLVCSVPSPLRALTKRVAELAAVPTPAHIMRAETEEAMTAVSTSTTVAPPLPLAARVEAAPLPRAQLPAPLGPLGSPMTPVAAVPMLCVRPEMPVRSASACRGRTSSWVPRPCTYQREDQAVPAMQAVESANLGSARRSASQGRSLMDLMDSKALAFGNAWAAAAQRSSAAMREDSLNRRSASLSCQPGLSSTWRFNSRSNLAERSSEIPQPVSYRGLESSRASYAHSVHVVPNLRR